MESVLTQASAIFFESKFLAARLAFQGVVVVTTFFANEENGFSFLFTFGHNWARKIGESNGVLGFGVKIARGNYCNLTPFPTSRNQKMSEDEGYETVDRQSSGDDLAKTSGTVSIIEYKNHPNELLL